MQYIFKNKFLLILLLIAAFLRFYRLDELMPFIPDQGWFYLSARDMLITRNIPLVGPPTSHPWIHHGPLWTYVLALILWLFHFNPVPPAYFIAILGVVTVWLMYKVASLLFSKRLGLIAVMLYATSPLIVANARTPYHTSPIPFFTLLFVFAVYKWIKGGIYYFPLITFLIGVLYNHEFTTFVLFIPVFLLAAYGFWKKKKWSQELVNRKIILYSFLTFIIPMLPFILYDITHGFRQTVGFLVWVGYRLIKFPLNILYTAEETFNPMNSLLEFSSYLQQLILAPNFLISIFILSISIGFFLSHFVKQLGKRNMDLGIMLLFLYLCIPLIGLFLHRVPIEADTLLLSPFLILVVSVFFGKIGEGRLLKTLSFVFVIIISFINSYSLFTNYLSVKSGENRMTFIDKVHAADAVIQLANGRDYDLIGRGVLSEFPVFTMPYEYLLWWKGHPPKKENAKLKIIVWEKDGKIIVYKSK